MNEEPQDIKDEEIEPEMEGVRENKIRRGSFGGGEERPESPPPFPIPLEQEVEFGVSFTSNHQMKRIDFSEILSPVRHSRVNLKPYHLHKVLLVLAFSYLLFQLVR